MNKSRILSPAFIWEKAWSHQSRLQGARFTNNCKENFFFLFISISSLAKYCTVPFPESRCQFHVVSSTRCHKIDLKIRPFTDANQFKSICGLHLDNFNLLYIKRRKISFFEECACLGKGTHHCSSR